MHLLQGWVITHEFSCLPGRSGMNLTWNSLWEDEPLNGTVNPFWVFERRACLASWLHIIPGHITLRQEMWPLSSCISYSPPVLCSNKEDVCDFYGKPGYSTAMPHTEEWSKREPVTPLLKTGGRFKRQHVYKASTVAFLDETFEPVHKGNTCHEM